MKLQTASVIFLLCCTPISASATSAQDAVSTMIKETEAKAENCYAYKLTGYSHLTSERVEAYLNQYSTDSSRLYGVIHDGLYTFHIEGVWDGKGLVKAKSLISTYTLEVIE